MDGVPHTFGHILMIVGWGHLKTLRISQW